MLHGGIIKKGFGLLLLLMAADPVFAQYNIQHQSPIAIERGQANPLEFVVPGLNESDIQYARLFYRFDGDFGYQQQEVSFDNGRFRTLFYVSDNSASSIEYYFEITLNSGEGVHYPSNLPSENPVEVEIVNNLEDEVQKRRLEEVDYTILSPTPGNGVDRNDVVIAIALFYDEADLEPGEFKLFLDQLDITSEADTSAYYLSYVPKGLRTGPHKVSLEYLTEEEAFLVVQWDFTVVAPGQMSTFVAASQSNLPQGQVEVAARNQVIAGDINNAYTGRTNVSGVYGPLRYSINGYLTSQESERLQPQNRYGINLSLEDWWKFQAGHVFPTISQLTISGRRVHGINTSLHLLRENINFHFVHGELERSIINQYDSLVVEDVVIGDTLVDSNYFLTYQDRGRGTFKRKITGGRFSLGNEEKLQLGFHALKIEDDTSSIYNVRDYLDIVNANPNLNSNLSLSDRERLQDNPGLLEIRGGSPRPRGNIVAGTDLKIGLDNNRIRFESEAVISALNNNIYGGHLSVERASDLGFDIDQDDADILEQLSWLIIVNENMSTLPLRLYEDENGDLDAEFFFPTSILGGNSELSFRYPVNNLRIQYRWIGPDFNSLANSTIRRDVAGFTFTDRVNLFSNRVYLTLGYETLTDNVAGTRNSTTETSTYRTNVSWYPVDRSLPRVSFGVRYRSRDNGIERQNHLLPDDLVNAAVQNLRQETRVINGQDSLVTLVTPTPRRNNSVNINTSITQQFNFLNARNDASLSLTNLQTTDEVFAFGDVVSTAVSLNLTSRFSDMPLQSQLGFTFNNTESGGGQSLIKIVGFYTGGETFLLENRLSINARLAVTQNETTSRIIDIRDNPNSDELNENPRDDYFVLSDDITENNFQTYVLQAGARFNINDDHALVFNANFTNVSGEATSNDRIVTLRYIFSF